MSQARESTGVRGRGKRSKRHRKYNADHLENYSVRFKDLPSTYYMPGTVISTLYISTHEFLTT